MNKIEPAPEHIVSSVEDISVSQKSLFVLMPLLIVAGIALAWYLSVALFTTIYAKYIVYIVLAIAVLVTSIFIVLLRSVLSSYIKSHKLLLESLGSKQEQNERCELVLKGSGQGYWDYDVRKSEIYFSSEFMTTLGYASKERTVPLSNWYDQIHPDDRDGVERTMKSHLDRRTPEYDIEYRIKRSNGEYMWAHDHGRAFWDKNGNAARVSGVTEDVGNIKRVQQVLESRTSELEQAKNTIEAEIQNVKKFQKAVDSSTEAVSITKPDGSIIYVNPAWERLNGYTESEALGRNPRILKSGKIEVEIYQALWEKISAGLTFASEDFINRRKDGTEYHAAISIFPIIEGKEILFFVCISQDITQRKEIDRAKTEFVSLASHQLRTPLSAIRWYSEMLMSKYVGTLNEKQQQYIKEIYQGNLRMVDLVNSLLNVSRIDLGTFAIEPEPVSLTEICDSVISELQPQITAKHQTIDKLYAQAPQTYLADTKLIRIIFQNFLSNSVKYTQEGGKLIAEISTKDNMLYIRIADNGYGIPRAQQPKIFEKLFRADNVRQKDTEGTGLGMYIVKAIVDSCGGKIWFDSDENMGTTFHVELPIAGMPRKSGAKGLT